MSVRFRVFASGKLKGTGQYYSLYPVPDGKSAVVNAMRFTNASSTFGNSTTFTIALRRRKSTPPEYILFPDARGLPLGPYMMAVEDHEITLGPNEEIVAKVDPQYHEQIHFIICGIERDA